jgi:glycosyltransferase involved in cell wall biosynthesis
MSFASKVGSHFAELRVIAREAPVADSASFPLPGVTLAKLPGYHSLQRVGAVLRVLPATIPALWRALDGIDEVWVTGVHPFGPLVAAFGLVRRRKVILLIRQDSMRYFRARLPSRGWRPILVPLKLIELSYRLLARFLPVTAVGPQIAARYGGAGPKLLDMRVTNFSAPEGSSPVRGPIGRPVKILCVGRIVPEKNPALAADALAALDRGGPGGYEMTWVGKGPLRHELLAHAEQLGVSEHLHLAGFVPVGPALLAHYRNADLLLHTSLTEGVPGVVLEALASGLPVVATDVGGVSSALDGGDAGLLVPPRDVEAIVTAITRLVDDDELRRRLSARGLELVGGLTAESESERVALFLASRIGG